MKKKELAKIVYRHDDLKQLAKKQLLQLGFKEEEIHEEYTVKSPEMKSRIVVDVVGIKPKHKVAIECGSVQGERLSQLKLFFDEVIVLPYINDGVLKEWIILKKESDERNSRLNKLIVEVEKLKSDSEIIYKSIENMLVPLEQSWKYADKLHKLSRELLWRIRQTEL